MNNCIKCGNDNDSLFFWIKKIQMKNGGYFKCRICYNNRIRGWRKNEEEKKSTQKARNKSWLKRKKWASNYYKKNRDKILVKTTKYRQDNPKIRDKINKTNRDSGKNKR